MKYSEFRNNIDIFIANNGDFNASDEIVTLWDKESSDYLKSLETHSYPKFCTRGGFDVSAPYGKSKWYVINGQMNFHYGIDIVTYTIVAIADGVVCDFINWGTSSKPNNAMYIMHDDDSAENGLKWLSKYGHIVNPIVNVGDRVKKGDVIGYVGVSNHVHFELWRLFNWRKWNVDVNESIGGRSSHSVNPLDYLYLQDDLYVVGRKKFLGYYKGEAVYYYSWDNKDKFKTV